MQRSSRSIAGWLFVCSSSVFFGGCATYLNKNRMVVGIESDPPKAKVFVGDSNEHICLTPCEYKIEKGGRHRLKIVWQANPAQTLEVKRSMHPGFWLNFLFGPGVILGMPIDFFTGSAFRPNYKGVFVRFDPSLTNDEAEEQEEKEQYSYQRLPNTPELLRIKEQFPEDYMRDQIDKYYGPQANEETYFRIIDRLYLVMIDMYRAGERLDSDEAIRRDLHS